MPPEPQAEEARLWIGKARGDLKAGAHDLTAAEPMTGDSVFHAQQAAEKAIKAFLILKGIRFRKTHDLRELGDLARRAEPSLHGVLTGVAELSPYATLFRYPGEALEPKVEEAREALELAEALVVAVESRVASG